MRTLLQRLEEAYRMRRSVERAVARALVAAAAKAPTDPVRGDFYYTSYLDRVADLGGEQADRQGNAAWRHQHPEAQAAEAALQAGMAREWDDGQMEVAAAVAGRVLEAAVGPRGAVRVVGEVELGKDDLTRRLSVMAAWYAGAARIRVDAALALPRTGSGAPKLKVSIDGAALPQPAPAALPGVDRWPLAPSAVGAALGAWLAEVAQTIKTEAPP